MTLICISILVIVFIIGFQMGKAYMTKGLALRVKQLYEEGKHTEAKFFEDIMNKSEKEHSDNLVNRRRRDK